VPSSPHVRVSTYRSGGAGHGALSSGCGHEPHAAPSDPPVSARRWCRLAPVVPDRQRALGRARTADGEGGTRGRGGGRVAWGPVASGGEILRFSALTDQRPPSTRIWDRAVASLATQGDRGWASPGWPTGVPATLDPHRARAELPRDVRAGAAERQGRPTCAPFCTRAGRRARAGDARHARIAAYRPAASAGATGKPSGGGCAPSLGRGLGT
jgi:hypothetical protein